MTIRARLLNPYTWVKLVASGIALLVNAIQLSEVSNQYGHPLPGIDPRIWPSRARLVAFEARQLRKHVGVVQDE